MPLKLRRLSVFIQAVLVASTGGAFHGLWCLVETERELCAGIKY